MSMEYTVFDSRTFCTGQERAMQLLYGEGTEADSPTGAALQLQTAASRLVSLLMSLKVRLPGLRPKPYIFLWPASAILRPAPLRG